MQVGITSIETWHHSLSSLMFVWCFVDVLLTFGLWRSVCLKRRVIPTYPSTYGKPIKCTRLNRSACKQWWPRASHSSAVNFIVPSLQDTVTKLNKNTTKKCIFSVLLLLIYLQHRVPRLMPIGPLHVSYLHLPRFECT